MRMQLCVNYKTTESKLCQDQPVQTHVYAFQLSKYFCFEETASHVFNVDVATSFLLTKIYRQSLKEMTAANLERIEAKLPMKKYVAVSE